MDPDMDFENESGTSSPTVKQEPSDVQTLSTAKNAGKKESKRPSKRNLVRWDDDLDKRVLLTMQWACNEVGLKIPWDLVAQTMGGGISEGAIVQHLSKLRSRMAKAKIEVPPTLRRGVVTKEPSKIYGSGNGKKLPPPVFADPVTPTQTKSRKQITPGTKPSPLTKPRSRARGKRRMSEIDDSDEGHMSVYPDESDEEYGGVKKKARVTKPKARGSRASKSKAGIPDSKAKTNKLAEADVEEINQDIINTLEDDEPPAKRTRHIKQDFTHLEQSFTDAEESEEEKSEGDDGLVKQRGNQEKQSPVDWPPSVSRQTVIPALKVDVNAWNQDVVANSSDVNFGDNMIMDQPVTMSTSSDLATPQLSRNVSTVSYGTASLNIPVPMGYGSNLGLLPQFGGYATFGYNGYDVGNQATGFGVPPVNYNGAFQPNPAFNTFANNLGSDPTLTSNDLGFDVNDPDYGQESMFDSAWCPPDN